MNHMRLKKCPPQCQITPRESTSVVKNKTVSKDQRRVWIFRFWNWLIFIRSRRHGGCQVCCFGKNPAGNRVQVAMRCGKGAASSSFSTDGSRSFFYDSINNLFNIQQDKKMFCVKAQKCTHHLQCLPEWLSKSKLLWSKENLHDLVLHLNIRMIHMWPSHRLCNCEVQQEVLIKTNFSSSNWQSMVRHICM